MVVLKFDKCQFQCYKNSKKFIIKTLNINIKFKDMQIIIYIKYYVTWKNKRKQNCKIIINNIINKCIIDTC